MTTLAAGGTIGRDHEKVAQMIFELEPDIVVVERFNLYPGKAKSLSWNSFLSGRSYWSNQVHLYGTWCYVG